MLSLVGLLAALLVLLAGLSLVAVARILCLPVHSASSSLTPTVAQGRFVSTTHGL